MLYIKQYFFPEQEIHAIPAQCTILPGGPYFHHPMCFVKIHVLFFSAGIVQVA